MLTLAEAMGVVLPTSITANLVPYHPLQYAPATTPWLAFR